MPSGSDGRFLRRPCRAPAVIMPNPGKTKTRDGTNATAIRTPSASTSTAARMAATVSSVYLSHWLLPQSIYTLKLHNRGVRYPYLETETTSARRSPSTQPGATAPEQA